MSTATRLNEATPATGTVSVTATNVRRNFGSRRAPFVAVDDVSLTVTSSSSIGIVGESGSGKSTLSRLLVGLDRPTSGSIGLDGVVTEGRPSAEVGALAASPRGNRQLRRVVQFVGQDTSGSFDPRWTLRQAVRRPAQQLRGLSAAEADAEIDELLVELGLDPATADRHPGQVSGGQRQRFSLARGLIARPRILMCDEVVSALDVSVQGAILNLVKRYCREHRCGLVFVSHGLPATAFVADEIVVMNSGKVVEHGLSREVLKAPRHPYTESLVNAYRRGERT